MTDDETVKKHILRSLPRPAFEGGPMPPRLHSLPSQRRREMRRAVVVIVLLAVAFGAPAAAEPSFTRAANTPAGRTVFESGPAAVTVLDSSDVWHYTGQDVVPFSYEQGVAHAGTGMGPVGDLVFSSRGSLVRTTLGCPAPDDLGDPCYDEEARNSRAIPADLSVKGYNHIGSIDVGRAGPANGFVFAPLETSSSGGTCPRSRRAYVAYDVATLQPAGALEEEVCHRAHSWVTVDPSGRWLIASDRGATTIRVYEISPDGTGVKFEWADRDVGLSPSGLPNFNGCSFRDEETLYCSDWVSSAGEQNVRTDVWRIDFGAPVGTKGAAASATRILELNVATKYASFVPFGRETEGLTFYRRNPTGPPEMHMLLRGETLAWVYFVHLAPGPPVVD